MQWHNFAWDRLADAAVGGLVVLALGSLAARLCRQPVRAHRLVILTLFGGVAVPLLGALSLAPTWSVGLIPAPAPVPARLESAVTTGASSRLRSPIAAESSAARALAERPEEMSAPAAAPALSFTASSAPAQPVAGRRWAVPAAGTLLVGCYLAVAAAFAACWIVGQVLLWWVTRSARPVRAEVRGLFLGLAGPGGRRVALLESDRINVPFTYTWLRPVILLPRALSGAAEPGGATLHTGARVVARRKA